MDRIKKRIILVMLAILLAAVSAAAVCASSTVKLNRRGASAAGDSPAVTFSQVANGEKHTIALSSDKKYVYAWGDNSKGQVGVSDGSLTVKAPAKVLTADPGIDVVKIAATQSSSAALLSDGKVITWGAAWENGTRSQISVPDLSKALELGAGNKIVALDISAGLRHYAVRTKADTTSMREVTSVVTWGYNNYHQVSGTADTQCLPAFTDSVLADLPGSSLGTGNQILGVTAGYNNTFVVYMDNSNQPCYYMIGENENNAYSAVSGPLSSAVKITDLTTAFLASESGVYKAAIGRDRIYTISSTGKLFQFGNGGSTNSLMDNASAVATSGNEVGTNGFVTGVKDTYGDVKVFGTAEWGTGKTAEITPDNALSLSIQGGKEVSYLTGGYSALQLVDTDSRIHILGSKTSSTAAKFPALSNTLAEPAPGTSMAYNFSTYSQMANGAYNGSSDPNLGQYYSNGKFYVLVPKQSGDTADYKVKNNLGKVDVDIDITKLLEKSPLGTNFGENTDAPQIVGADGTIDTRYGKISVQKPKVVVTTGTTEDALTLAVKDEKTLTVSGKAGTNKPTTDDITVKLYLKETAGGLAGDENIVNIFTAEIKVVYGNWVPKAADRSVKNEFHADANKRQLTNGQLVPISFSDSATDYSYKSKTFTASELVRDPDNDGSRGDVRFVKETFEILSGIDTGDIEVQWPDGDLSSSQIVIVAKKSCKGTVQVRVRDDATESDYANLAALVTLDIDVRAEASSVVSGINDAGELVIKAEEFDLQKGSCTKSLDDLYDDSDNLIFRDSIESNSYVRVLRDEFYRSITISSSITNGLISGNTVGIIVEVGSKADSAAPGALITIRVTFPSNSAPSKKTVYNNPIKMNQSTMTFTAGDLFDDTDLAFGDQMSLSIVQNGTRGIFEATCTPSGDRLTVKPLQNGSDKLAIRVKDLAGHTGIWMFTFEVVNQYDTPVIAIGNTEKKIDASYLATFLYNLPMTLAEREETKVTEATVTGGIDNVTCRIASDSQGKVLIVTPTKSGTASITANLEVTVKGVVTNVSMKINVQVINQYDPAKSILLDMSELKDAKQYTLTVQDLIAKLGLVGNDGAMLVADRFIFESVYLTGNEKYATARISETDSNILYIVPLANTPQAVQAAAEDGGEYLQIVLVSKSGTERYSVQFRVEVSNFKQYPTDTEYKWIFTGSCAGAGLVILVLILISFGVSAHRKREYSMAMERAKARDRMKKAAALGADKDQMLKRGLGQTVKINPTQQKPGSIMTPSMMGNPFGKQPQQSMGMNNPQPQQSMGMNNPQPRQNMGMNNPQQQMENRAPAGQPMSNPASSQAQAAGRTAWQMGQTVPTPPPEKNPSQQKAKRTKRNGSMLALDSSEGPEEQEESLPPLKAQTHVPKDARDEIESKIQARIAQENAMRQQQMQESGPADDKKKKKKDDEGDGPKMSRADKKKQEMLDKLRAKMMADRNK